MNSNKSIELLNRQLGQIDELKNLNHENNQYRGWRQLTASLIARIFGEKSQQLKNFERASIRLGRITEAQNQKFYIDDLEEKSSFLRAMITEIELLPTNELSGEIANLNNEDIVRKYGKDIEKLTDDEERVFNEAIRALDANAFTPCALACRAIFESIIRRTVSSNSLRPAGSGISSQIDAIENAGLVNRKHHKHLINITKHFGDKSQHEIETRFDRKKCDLIISAILILLDEVF